MLDYIRSNAQSFGVKVAFAIIILVFMFWGVGSLTDGGSSNVVAKVNGEAITAQQFEQAYQRAAEYAMRNDPSLTREALQDEVNIKLVEYNAEKAYRLVELLDKTLIINVDGRNTEAMLEEGLPRLALVVAVSVCSVACTVYFVGCTKAEREFVVARSARIIGKLRNR